MTEQTTPLEKLQLNGRYYRCLIRHGYTTIEQIENYLSDKNAEPLSKNIANMSPRGDYEVADSIHSLLQDRATFATSIRNRCHDYKKR